MMSVIAYIGPMWSGKTSSLYKAAMLHRHKVFFLDMYNTRNSERDLKNMLDGIGTEITTDYICTNDTDLILIDEVHLWDIPKLVSFLDKQREGKYLLSGLLFNYYKEFEMFPVCPM